MNRLYFANPRFVIFVLLFFHPAALKSLALAQAMATFFALPDKKIPLSNFHKSKLAEV
jgi:hypothetical protein